MGSMREHSRRRRSSETNRQNIDELDDVEAVELVAATYAAASEKLLLPIFEPYLDKGQIAGLASYNFYVKINALKNIEPLSGETIVIENPGSESIAKQVIWQSRKNYAASYTKPLQGKSMENDEGEPDIDDDQSVREIGVHLWKHERLFDRSIHFIL